MDSEMKAPSWLLDVWVYTYDARAIFCRLLSFCPSATENRERERGREGEKQLIIACMNMNVQEETRLTNLLFERWNIFTDLFDNSAAFIVVVLSMVSLILMMLVFFVSIFMFLLSMLLMMAFFFLVIVMLCGGREESAKREREMIQLVR